MRNLGSWSTALVASIALHVVILGLLIGFRGCSDTEKTPPVQPQRTDGRATNLPEKSPEEKTSQTFVNSSKDNKSAVDPIVKQIKQSKDDKPTDKQAKDDKSQSEIRDDDWKTYKIKPGDSLTRIARHHGMSVQELAKANGLSTTANLKLGQTIKVKNQ